MRLSTGLLKHHVSANIFSCSLPSVYVVNGSFHGNVKLDIVFQKYQICLRLTEN